MSMQKSRLDILHGRRNSSVVQFTFGSHRSDIASELGVVYQPCGYFLKSNALSHDHFKDDLVHDIKKINVF